MLRNIIIAGIAIASSAAYAAPFAPTPDSSKVTVKYTIGKFCDGLTLTQKPNGTATGRHTGCGGDQFAGGLRGVIDGQKIWFIVTYDGGDAATINMYALNESALTWKLYEMTGGSSKFSANGSGKLVVGTPELKKGAFGAPMRSSSGVVLTK